MSVNELNFLINNFCSVEFTDSHRKIIRCDDLTDEYNLPCCFSQNVRWIDKAWSELKEKFNSDMKMWDVFDFLREKNLKPHQYCRMD